MSTNTNNKIVSENIIRSYTGCTKINLAQLLFHDTLLKSNFHDIKGMTVSYNSSPFQNDEKWIENFEGIISLFDLNDLYKLIFRKICMVRKAKLPIQSSTKLNS